MKVRYINEDYGVSLSKGTVYDVLEVETRIPKLPFYKIVDDMKDTAYYPFSDFEIVEKESDQ